MGRSDEEFYKGTLGKVLTLIELHAEFKTGKVKRLENQSKEVTSMKQILGLR